MQRAAIAALVAGFAACVVVPFSCLAASAHADGPMSAEVRRQITDGHTLVWWDRKSSAYMGAPQTDVLPNGWRMVLVDVVWIDEVAAAKGGGTEVAWSGPASFDCHRRLVRGSDGEDYYYADGYHGSVTGGPIGPSYQSLFSAAPAMRVIAARVCR